MWQSQKATSLDQLTDGVEFTAKGVLSALLVTLNEVVSHK